MRIIKVIYIYKKKKKLNVRKISPQGDKYHLMAKVLNDRHKISVKV